MMVRKFSICLVLLAGFLSGSAQTQVGINTNSPDASAVVEIVSTDKGLLIPRVDSTARMAIANPATGLMVFDSSTNSFWFSTPEGWQEISAKSFINDAMLELQGIRDIDNNKYETIQIGDQVWMTENLRVSRYNDGTPIPLVTSGAGWANLNTPGYTWYEDGRPEYGALYNWWVVDPSSNGGRNVCPVGWHVPTDAEWTTLSNQLGGNGVSGGKLKETGLANWSQPNTQATNESGFHALPSGFRFDNGAFFGERFNCSWWTSTQFSASNGWSRLLEYNSNDSVRETSEKKSGLSVRCMKD